MRRTISATDDECPYTQKLQKLLPGDVSKFTEFARVYLSMPARLRDEKEVDSDSDSDSDADEDGEDLIVEDYDKSDSDSESEEDDDDDADA
ncbi:hypothetical protein A1Q1_07948 [Trichosporon asahii var. asahii CBS 2479]|uniref:Uncharacterized protein n=1 Tax=Trichosporon asahii var. asahii (strain ATCC 90039 / CBS 2479 / JCM 2466 / KCTC 7840 / NBRC 103889/ NCYC 2677 / UAMH 7654) TaxID=1186058 RepID=J5TH19_TRIAS|nr:hypothetical protein A1Q1_07948 [Trichosporon asahii var. asahii CBS 2479]EJT50886.1 hypothetical protein A1Q1_07948 [Trichosporon asahii var. asahii CBS 2479]